MRGHSISEALAAAAPDPGETIPEPSGPVSFERSLSMQRGVLEQQIDQQDYKGEHLKETKMADAKILALCLAVALASTSASAQRNVVRNYRSIEVAYRVEATGEIGRILVPAAVRDTAGILEKRVYLPAAGGGIMVTDRFQQLTLPFEVPGGVTRLGPAEYLLGGQELAVEVGHIVRVRIDDAGVPSVVEHAVLGAGIDPAGLCYNEARGELLLWDSIDGEIAVAEWEPSQSIPTSYATVLTAGRPGAADFVESPWSYTLVDRPDGSLRLYPRSSTSLKIFDIATPSYAVTPVPPSGGELQPGRLYVQQASRVNSRGMILIRGPAGRVDFRNLDTGLVVASCTIDPARADVWWAYALSAVPGAVVPGVKHRLEHTDGLTHTIAPLERWGEPVSRDGLEGQRGLIHYGKNHVGAGNFGVSAGFGLGSLPTGTASFVADVYLLIGASVVGGSAPVTEIAPDNYLVDAIDIETLPKMEFREDLVVNAASHTFPIASDPALEGVKLYFQFVVTTPAGNVSKSDVFAAAIRPAPAIAAQLTGGPQSTAQNSGSGSPGAQVAALTQWLGSLSPQEALLLRSFRD